MNPVIKWAGGKRQLLPEIEKYIPKSYNTYYEPFFGGGALYFHISPTKAIINDINPQLINVYNQIKFNSSELIEILSIFEIEYNSFCTMEEKDKYYYSKRAEYNNCLFNNIQTVYSAALLIFLNKTGFNGLYRVNKTGQYNVPSGHKEKINLYDKNNIQEIQSLLNSVTICSDDFENVCETAQAGDFIFFDSPYYDTFTSYQASGFSEKDHKRLHNLFRRLTEKGVFCMTTNNNCEYIRNLYKDFNIREISVKRMINRDASNRTGEEVIITNY